MPKYTFYIAFPSGEGGPLAVDEESLKGKSSFSLSVTAFAVHLLRWRRLFLFTFMPKRDSPFFFWRY